MVPQPPAEPVLEYQPPDRVNFGWIGEGFTLFGQAAGVWILTTLIATAISLIVSAAADFALGDPFQVVSAFQGRTPVQSLRQVALIYVVEGIGLAVWSLFYGAFQRMANRQVRREKIVVADLFKGGRLFLPILGYHILFSLSFLLLEAVCLAPFGLEALLTHVFTRGSSPSQTSIIWLVLWAVLGGLCLLFFGSAFWAMVMPGYALVADGMGALNAWRRSIQKVRPHWLAATGLTSVLSLLFFAIQIVTCNIGLLFLIPLAWLVLSLAYRDVIGMPGYRPPPPPDYGAPQEGVWPPPPTAGGTP